MTDRTKMPRLAVAVILTLCAATAALAAGPRARLETPRQVIREHRLFTLAPQGQVLPLGIGKPANFAMDDTWITSDQLLDDFSTDFAFFTGENLSVVAAFYSRNERNVTVSLQVRSEGGTTLLEDGFTDVAAGDSINFFILDLGAYSPGAYKLILKVKQGSKVIGQQYWFFVFDEVAAATR